MAYDRLIKRAPPLTVSRFVQVLAAAHLSYKVKGFAKDRGGIIVVGPPGTLKSTLISTIAKHYADALELSDVNVQALARYRDGIVVGKYHTLVFPEMAKLYERHPNVAKNIEGTIRSLVAEGFREASFEPTVNQVPARCLVVGALTTATMRLQTTHWEESGFTRRFLWPTVNFNQDRLDEAVDHWKLVDLRLRIPMSPNGTIPIAKTHRIGQVMRALCQHQPGNGRVLQAALLRRIYSVLCWYHSRCKDPEQEAMRTVLAFGRALGHDGTDLVVPTYTD